MTSNDLQNKKVCTMAICYKSKARNPGNTVAATNPVLNFLMTSNDLLEPKMTSKNENVLAIALCISNES